MSSLGMLINIQGRRKQFYIGQANSGHYIFNHVGKGPPIDTQSVASVKHNQYAKHVNYYRGSVACSPGKFGKKML